MRREGYRLVEQRVPRLTQGSAGGFLMRFKRLTVNMITSRAGGLVSIDTLLVAARWQWR